VKLDFFICGVQKGGTTALDSFLREHPAVQMAKIKEVHFFDDESHPWEAPEYAKLHAFFDFSSLAKRRGEATPIYSYWPNSMERLRAYNPAARLILLLRHPVLRALSHWRMETTRGRETLPFGEAIRPAARERVRLAPGGIHSVFSYVERGFYARQIERIMTLFPADQLLVLRTDALWNNPAHTLAKVQSFLDIKNVLRAERRYIVPAESDHSTPLHREDADYLLALYADDIRKTQHLTGVNLEDWLTVAAPYAEPMAEAPSGRCG
jgi:Sulfotransferase domain